MLWFLIRAAVVAFILYFLYLYMTAQSLAVQRHYAWMHPELTINP